MEVGGHEHTGVEYLHQTVLADDLDGFAGEGRPDPIGESGPADLAPLIHPPAHTRRSGRNDHITLLVIGDGGIGRLLPGPGQTEPPDRRDVTNTLVRADRVVLDHLDVEGGLGLERSSLHS